MTDLEGLTKRLLRNNTPRSKIIEKIVEEYKIYKEVNEKYLIKLAEAIYEECTKSESAIQKIKNSQNELIKKVLINTESGATMGEAGVGCRGIGDFYVHKLLTKISKTTTIPFISPESLDDTGAIKIEIDRDVKQIKKDYNKKRTNDEKIKKENKKIIPKNKDKEKEKHASEKDTIIILTKMEGMHSRLSDYPFLAGFHVARATLRDIYVKGGVPLSIMIDLHLADDGDVAKLFDFQAGVATVAEIAKVPITAGSTLRIGGDMVIGPRLTGGLAGIGIQKFNYFRKNIKKGDKIIMTEGAGGGTITTTALYANFPEVIEKTINLKFLEACKTIFEKEEIAKKIHSMADVTNGGLRGDLYEINYESGCGVIIFPNKVRNLIQKDVLSMLDKLNIDYLGVSLDALLIFAPSEISEKIIEILKEKNINAQEIGEVIEDNLVLFREESGDEEIIPRFRESPYTAIKKAIDIVEINEEKKENFEKLKEKRLSGISIHVKKKIQKAFEAAVEKKKFITSKLQKK